MKALKRIVVEHLRYKKTIFRLAKSDLVKTYKGTALGWWWAIIKPATILAVYYFALTIGLRVPSPVEEYPYFLWLIVGFVPWFYMRDMITAGAASVKKYRFLVTKIKYPLSTIPTFVAISYMATEIALMIVVIIIFILSGNMPDVYWLQIPLYMLIMFLFFSAWSLFAGMLAAFSSDFMQLVKSFTIMLFWGSGIMYDVNTINNSVIKSILLINPITVIVNGFRKVFIYKEWFWEDTYSIVVLCITFLIMLSLAVFCYKKLERDIVDIL